MSYVEQASNLSLSRDMGMVLWNASVSNLTELGEVPLACSGCANLKICRFIGAVAVSMPLIILGVLANVFAFVVLCCQRQRLPTTVLLQALAILDTILLLLFFLLSPLPVLSTHASAHSTMRSYLAAHTRMYNYLYPSMYFARLANTWMTVLLSAHRYVTVCRPRRLVRMMNLSTVYRNIIIVLLLSAVFSIPRCFEYNRNGVHLRPTSLVQDVRYIISYRIVLFSACMYVLPMTLLVWFSSKLCCQLHHVASFETATHQQTRSLTTGRSRDTTKSSTVIVVTLVSICVACNLAACISHLLWSLHICFSSLRHLGVPRRYMSIVSNILVVFNSSVNFFVYCACSQSFRKACVSMIVRRLKPHSNISLRTGSTSPSNTITQYPLQHVNAL